MIPGEKNITFQVGVIPAFRRERSPGCSSVSVKVEGAIVRLSLMTSQFNPLWSPKTRAPKSNRMIQTFQIPFQRGAIPNM